MRVVIGVDSSTQSVKVEARDLDSGQIVATTTGKHPQTTPPVSEHEPPVWWEALTGAVNDLDDEIRAAVVAMSIGGQQHGLVLLDDEGEPVRPAKLWNDTTSAPQSDRLVAALGADAWARRTGSVPVAAFTITKLAWVADNEPDALARAVRVMLPHDYLTLRLTGRHVTDRGDASGSGWYDPVSDAVDRELIDLAAPGWSGATPEVLAASEAAGEITADAADALGLPGGVVIGPGTGDNMAAGLGLGLAPGDVVISLGTSGTVFAESLSPTTDPSGAVAGFASATGNYLPLVCTLNATKVTDTVAQWLGTDAPGLAMLALQAAADPGSALLVPYFDGERTPNRPEATGTLIGLTNSTDPAQIALAAHDGVLCGLLDGLDALTAAGARLDGSLLLIGGGRRSAAYRQRLADLSGRPVRIPEIDEAVATGAAVQAAVVAGGDDFAELSARWGLDGGSVVTPATDATDRRAAYATAIADGGT